jgi:hypothetical protein
LARVHHLLALHEESKHAPTRQPGDEVDDVLRAALVFTHATLEDFLRTLATIRLPNAEPSVLNRIPLVGAPARAEKFGLADLAAHRGRTVQDVVDDSVREHLARATFNNTTDIANHLTACSVDLDCVKEHFPAIERLVKRRHHIVHQADLSEISVGKFVATPISVEEVVEGVARVVSVVAGILTGRLVSYPKAADAAAAGD